jgi:hypothetical protein
MLEPPASFARLATKELVRLSMLLADAFAETAGYAPVARRRERTDRRRQPTA